MLRLSRTTTRNGLIKGERCCKAFGVISMRRPPLLVLFSREPRLVIYVE
jgi:hypothetical protein